MYKRYCTKCGSELVFGEEEKGTYSKSPDYFDSSTGDPYFHRKVYCPNGGFLTSHTEFYNTYSRQVN
jgi:hypothetical protein